MIQFTEKEINYQLDWDWDIEKVVFEEDNNGQYHYGPISYVDKTRRVEVRNIETPSGVRINFNPDLEAKNLKKILVGINDQIDFNGVRAFALQHGNIKEYYPAHTRYEGEDSNGYHLVEFIIREETQFPLSNGDRVTLEYALHPDADLEASLFAYFLTRGVGESLKLNMTIEPGMNIEVQVNNQKSTELAFSTPREGEEFLKGEMKELANSIKNEI